MRNLSIPRFWYPEWGPGTSPVGITRDNCMHFGGNFHSLWQILTGIDEREKKVSTTVLEQEFQ